MRSLLIVLLCEEATYDIDMNSSFRAYLIIIQVAVLFPRKDGTQKSIRSSESN
jgi:hypothetical protein